MIKLEKINIKCPCCDEDILITIGEEKVVVECKDSLDVSDSELNKIGIEFG